MDIAAHALWAGAGVLIARRQMPSLKITPRTVALTMVMAALPDVIHLLPLLGWWSHVVHAAQLLPARRGVGASDVDVLARALLGARLRRVNPAENRCHQPCQLCRPVQHAARCS